MKMITFSQILIFSKSEKLAMFLFFVLLLVPKVQLKATYPGFWQQHLQNPQIL